MLGVGRKHDVTSLLHVLAPAVLPACDSRSPPPATPALLSSMAHSPLLKASAPPALPPGSRPWPPWPREVSSRRSGQPKVPERMCHLDTADVSARRRDFPGGRRTLSVLVTALCLLLDTAHSQAGRVLAICSEVALTHSRCRNPSRILDES